MATSSQRNDKTGGVHIFPTYDKTGGIHISPTFWYIGPNPNRTWWYLSVRPCYDSIIWVHQIFWSGSPLSTGSSKKKGSWFLPHEYEVLCWSLVISYATTHLYANWLEYIYWTSIFLAVEEYPHSYLRLTLVRIAETLSSLRNLPSKARY